LHNPQKYAYHLNIKLQPIPIENVNKLVFWKKKFYFCQLKM